MQRLEVDEEHREHIRARDRIRTKQRLEEGKEYRECNRARARIRIKQRLEDEQHREQNRVRARFLTHKRRTQNVAYRKKCVEWAKASRMARLARKENYLKQDCTAAAIRKKGTGRRWISQAAQPARNS